MLEGYITYTRDSVYSPEYPYPIMGYSSPSQAIDGGNDPKVAIDMFVSMRRDIFFPTRYYTFSGKYSDYINRSVNTLYVPREEEIDVVSYVMPISNIDSLIPTVQVKRYVYKLEKVRDNIYRQRSPLPIMEEYRLGLADIDIDNKRVTVPLYIGSKGMFVLLDRV